MKAHLIILLIVIFALGWTLSSRFKNSTVIVTVNKEQKNKEVFDVTKDNYSLSQSPGSAPVGNNQVSMRPEDITPFYNDGNLQSTGAEQGDTWFSKPMNLPEGQQYPSGCLLGCNSCRQNCSGEGNRCGITAPVPSPAWQPQSASTVAYRLKTGNYVPSYCPQGRLELQKAPGCQGTFDLHASSQPYETTCYTSQRPPYGL